MSRALLFALALSGVDAGASHASPAGFSPMSHTSRALLVAPVARDLAAEFTVDVIRVPGATNGVLQAWDTLDEHFFTQLGDAQITVYPTFQSIPTAMLRYLVQFWTATTAQFNEPYTLKRWLDCTAADFIRVANNGDNSVKRVTNLVAGDRPRDFEPVHRWLGNVEETLGEA